MIAVEVKYDWLATSHLDSRSILCGLLVRDAYLKKASTNEKPNYDDAIQQAFDFGKPVESIAGELGIPLEVLRLEYGSESLLELAADTIFVQYAYLFSDVHAALSDPESDALTLGFTLFLVASGFFVPYLVGEFNQSRLEPYEEYLLHAAYLEAGFSPSTVVNVTFEATHKWKEFRVFRGELPHAD